MTTTFRKNLLRTQAACRGVAGLLLCTACWAAPVAHAGTPPQTAPPGQGANIPQTTATALDGHSVQLPNALPGRATVLILGFGRHSQDATTAWEKPVRMQLAQTPAIGFYDIAMLGGIPSFARGFAVRSIHKAVPSVLQPNFLPLFDQEEAWKRAAGYADDQPEAAYVLLVDRQGRVRWATHQAYTPALFEVLRAQAQHVAGE